MSDRSLQESSTPSFSSVPIELSRSYSEGSSICSTPASSTSTTKKSQHERTTSNIIGESLDLLCSNANPSVYNPKFPASAAAELLAYVRILTVNKRTIERVHVTPLPLPKSKKEGADRYSTFKPGGTTDKGMMERNLERVHLSPPPPPAVPVINSIQEEDEEEEQEEEEIISAADRYKTFKPPAPTKEDRCGAFRGLTKIQGRSKLITINDGYSIKPLKVNEVSSRFQYQESAKSKPISSDFIPLEG